MDQPPLILAGDRVSVLASQEADVVGVLKIVYRVGIASELAVVELNGANVLVSAMDEFVFAVALDLSADSGNASSQRDDDQSDRKNSGDEEEAAFFVAG